MEAIITCENLVKIYKVADLEVVALQGLDLIVQRGEMLGIVGASGSGKSTLLNILGGLDRPSAGRVTVDGSDLLKLSNKALDSYRRTRVGFLWQQTARNLIPYLTAMENVQLPMTVAGMRNKEKASWAKELLDAVSLYDRRNHHLTQLSGGEQQRIGIAVALANKPTLLLGDEPTGEVDTAAAQAVLGIFHRLRDQMDLTILIVTHDPRVAGQVDRVVAIRDGKTSTETIRQVSDLEHAMVGDRPPEGAECPTPSVTYHEYIVLDSAGRLQIPREYLDQYAIGDRVQLEPTDGGLLIQPIGCSGRSTDDSLLSVEAQVRRLFHDEPPKPRKSWLTRLRGRTR